ncbi:glycoside hydrolase family 30 protein [Streptomyces sp. 4N509B]|uniref:glycoside hydrolase family 30 protein n=1 Tax=Streptomyces sp. 4N509B TaxID=3457413 RepID=UPI003FCF02A6
MRKLSTAARRAVAGAVAATLLPVATATATTGATDTTTDRVPRATGTVDLGRELQTMDGFGISQAFQRAAVMDGLQGLSEENQREVLDLLLDRETGAGISILRLGIGSSPDEVYDHMRSIQPTDPGGPDATPRYEWDGYDGGQVWLAREAQAHGVERFFADAWSAPGYMKTNGSDANGGTLCGLSGASCGSGDWRQAYADYLLQYVRFYAEEGIEITDLGFTNEPDLTTSYASMRFSPQQAVDFARVLGRTIEDSEFPGLNLVCCDAAGWEVQRPFTSAIEADPEASSLVDLHTGHNYVNQARSPLPTDEPTWMSEWSPNGDRWNEAWDDGSGFDGMTVARDIHAALTQAGVTGYVYWFGASTGTTRGFVQMDGASYNVSKRLWAFAAYSRFIRPDAVRLDAWSGSSNVSVTAFRNAGDPSSGGGSTVLEILNNGYGTENQTFSLTGGTVAGTGSVYLTDAGHDLERTGEASVSGGQLSLRLPPRSLTTVVLD